jgi:hypothetical protein
MRLERCGCHSSCSKRTLRSSSRPRVAAGREGGAANAAPLFCARHTPVLHSRCPACCKAIVCVGSRLAVCGPRPHRLPGSCRAPGAVAPRQGGTWRGRASASGRDRERQHAVPRGAAKRGKSRTADRIPRNGLAASQVAECPGERLDGWRILCYYMRRCSYIQEIIEVKCDGEKRPRSL